MGEDRAGKAAVAATLAIGLVAPIIVFALHGSAAAFTFAYAYLFLFPVVFVAAFIVACFFARD